MELMVRSAAVALTAAVLGTLLRRHTPELALLLVLGAGVWMLSLAANALGAAVELLEELSELTGVEEELLRPVVKTAALSLVTRLTAEMCRGTGESGLAAFLEITGTALALGVALPLIRAVLTLLGELLG